MSTNIRLNLILERFSYPITEEQAWGICYLTASELKSLPGPWIFTPDNIHKADRYDEESDELPMEAVLFNRSGELKLDKKVLSSRFVTSDSGASSSSTTDSDSDSSSFLSSNSLASNATEYDLMGPIAVMLYKALDYRLDDSEERELSPQLSSLIEVMLDASDGTPSIGSPIFGDGDTQDMPFDFQTKCLDAVTSTLTHSTNSPRHSAKSPEHPFCLSDVIHRCRSHFFEIKEHSGDTLHSHYTHVCKGMVDEYFSCNLNLDNFNFNERLRSWDQIVQSIDLCEYDLKNSSTFLNVEKSDLENITEISDLDFLQTQIRAYDKQNMRHVKTNSHQRLDSKLDPFKDTLECIKHKKYTLKPMEDRVMNEPDPITRASTPHEMLMEEIQQAPPLKEVPPELKRRYTIDLHKMKYLKKYNTPKRFYPPKTECLDEDDIEVTERQAIVHGRSVSLPYDKLKIYKVPIQKELDIDSNSSQSTDNLNSVSQWSSPTNYNTDSYCSLDDLTADRDSYYPRSSSADILDLQSSRGCTRSTSRETMILNCDESSYGEGSEYQSVYEDLYLRDTSPFTSSSFYPRGSSRSLGSKEFKQKKKHHLQIKRPSTTTFTDSKSKRVRSPLYNSGVSQLQELSCLRHDWIQSQLAELAYTYPSLYEDTMLGKICHVCYTNFSWKKWGSHCKLCRTKICSNCKTTKIVPDSFFGCSQIADNPTTQKKPNNAGRKLLVCQHCNFFLCGKFNETSSFFNK